MSKERYITKKNQLKIAEFVHAEATDTLIISEVKDAIDALHESGLMTTFEKKLAEKNIEKKQTSLLFKMISEATSKIPNEVGTEIMNKYYAGKL